MVPERRPAEYRGRGKAQKGRPGARSKAADDPGGAGYEIAKEAVMCPSCSAEHLAKEAALEAESLDI